ncbi:hypothetical protein ACJ41P_10700 [Azospirillum argentinense]|uniref:ASCH domain-containing protein n=1 Tax=Azospirillum argentinense TaxID=2970906 RepID=A0ABW8V895_9PROT
MAEKLVVGQKLWRAPIDRRDGEPRWVEITHVGRRLATVEQFERIDAHTLVPEICRNGGFVRNRFYRTKEEWEVERERTAIWRTLRDNIDHYPPADISTDAIRRAAALLGITLPDDGVSNG